MKENLLIESKSVFLGHWASVYVLLLAGANTNSQNHIANTPLHFAVEKLNSLGYKNHSSYTNYTKVIEILLQSNADRHIKNAYQKSPLDLAHDQGSSEIRTKVLF